MQVYLVSNNEKFKHYERWATANSFPRVNIINTGATATVLLLPVHSVDRHLIAHAYSRQATTALLLI